MECKQMVAYQERLSDGHKCNHCKGMLKAINTGTKEQLANRYISDIEFPNKRNNKTNIAINLRLEDINKISIGLRLVDAFSSICDRVTFGNIISSDKETKDILIKESDLLKIIQMVNPAQADRKIRLIE
jgi:hypothetical protein